MINHKSTATAYIMWFLLGAVGGHHFYLGHVGRAIGIIALLLLALPTDGATMVILGPWMFWDLFAIPSQVRKTNNRLIEEHRALMKEMRDDLHAS